MPRSENMLPTRTYPHARRANPSFQPHRIDGFLEASNRQIVYTSLLCALQHQPGGMSADCEDGALINCLNTACDRPYHICRKWWAHVLCGGPPCNEGDVHHDTTFNFAVVGIKGDQKARMAVHGIRPNCNSLLFGGGVYDYRKGPRDCGNVQCRFGHDKLSHRHQLALVGVKLGKDFRKELGYPKGKLLQLTEGK
ncbi:hypothetical protein B0A48_02298 [Cryoendolithus antarcticus]|uniref:Uncharacterized protein n=1 Tax=Cryoendolithus antarcticus TaxID=1507870 RepID=A0A1V8TNF3_9PEZI|nr:hypothetical protein B0A48_02298 [Cryoendolithus antarcticus]